MPDSSVESVRSLVDETKVSDGQGASLVSPLLDACVEQLPVSPLADKLAEGLTKRVSPVFISRALNKRLESYRFARALLMTRKGSLDADALAVIGAGVDEGVSREDFEVYVSEFSIVPNEQFLTGLNIVSLNGQVGFSPELSRRIIRYGLSNESLGADWAYFVRIILTARKRGVDDETIAAAAVDVLSDGGIVSDVIEKLGFTGRDLGDQKESE